MVRIAFLIALLVPTALLSAQSLPVVDEHGNFTQRDDRPVGVLRIRAQCGDGGELNRSRILDQEAKQSGALRKNDRDPAAWYALGCSRALLFAAEGRAREGLLMPPSTSWANGAVSALLRGLAIDSLHVPSLELLAALALETAPNVGAGLGGLNNNHPDRIVDPARSVAPITYAAQSEGLQPSPLVLRACVSLSLHVSLFDYRDAVTCANRALRIGHDSTWHFLRLAYVSFRGLDLPLGNHYFEAAATAAHTTEDRAEVGWHLWGRAPGWFGKAEYMQAWQRMEPDEWSQLLTMADSSFLPWVRNRNAALSRVQGMGPDRLGHHFHAVIHHASGFRDCAGYVGAFAEAGKPCAPLKVFDLRRAALIPLASAFRLYSPVTGERLLLVPMVVSGNDVTYADSGNTIEAGLALWEAGPNRWRDAQLHLEVPAGRDKTMIGGVLSIPDSGGTLAWQLSMRDRLRGKAGSVAGDSPDFTRGAVGMSDLVLGSPARAIPWDLDGRSLLLSPSMRFARDEPVELYFQLWCDVPPREVRVELALYGTREQDTLPRLQLGFAHQLTQRFAELERVLDFAQLDAGEYRLEVTVRGGDGGVLVQRTARIGVE